MNWKKEAENELRQYSDLCTSLINIRERIESVETAMSAIKGSSSSVPVHGGGNRYEDNLLDLIVEKDRLKALYNVNSQRVKIIKRGLDALNETENKVINCFYILNMKYSAAVDRLREEIGYEEAHINRIRNKALYHYTVAEFGLPEL
jgi:DNA-directed RNA polymerase sigma subunit (sigma70/sigma32)